MKEAFSQNLLITNQTLANDPFVRDSILNLEYSRDAPYIPVASRSLMQLVVSDESLSLLLQRDLTINHSLTSIELKQFLHNYETVFGRGSAVVTLQSTSMPVVHLSPEDSKACFPAIIEVKNSFNPSYTAATLFVYVTATFELTETNMTLSARVTDL